MAVMLATGLVSAAADAQAKSFTPQQQKQITNAVVPACFKRQKSLPENEGILDSILKRYCVCVAAKIVRTMSVADATNWGTATAREREKVLKPAMAARGKAAAQVCIKEMIRQ